MANYVYATDPRKPIPIGVQGENDARTVVFDIHSWIEDYGNGSALLVHQRPGDAEPYPVTTAQKAGTVEWTVQQADIIAGAPGRAQLSYQVGENIVARSPIYLTIAADEITNTTLTDYDPAESWLNAILGAVQEAGDITDEVQAAKNAAAQAAASAEKAEEYSGKPPIITDDIWYTWDADAGEYKSTGEPSRGPAGPQGEQGPQGKTGTQGTAAGFGEATARVDGSTGTPDVTVSLSGPDTAKVFDFQFSGLKGQTGAAAGFGEITATVGATVGTPSVSVEASGPDTAKNLAFAFTNLKGKPGQSVGSIQRTAGTGAPGTTDTYTMYDSDGGTIGTFTVYNGTDGTGSGDFKADGSVAMTGDLNAGGHRVTNVGAPTAAGDAVRQSDLQAVSDEIDAIIAGTTPVAVPVATDAKAGVVMPGDHLSVEADGTLNAEWPDLSGYATEDWVTGRGYITDAALTGYATQAWVEGKNYLTAVPDEYVTSTELTEALGDYVTADTLTGYGYITSAALIGYATESWVQSRGYLTAVPAEYLTESEAAAAYVPLARTINSKALTSNVELSASDVGAAVPATAVTATLTTAGWSASGSRVAQTVSVSGLAADAVVVVDVALSGSDPDADAEVLAAWAGPASCNVTQAAGSITFYSAEAPTLNIPIVIGVV